ncbi:Magnesium-protoporphyrin O-methyltransferase [Tetrabaena socialis]|uniref:Magnesium-protoporphyrin O-methyltransferase n=1 Tax=Tetrabaena socialis TaxID=47790 RepID=A0A2J8AAQ5_9CHLO|nr:Magnesium-protoporphyrin O-methyltransferase [Tetrabaena socialis]|eukprot:PNH09601.1 Magnesium-protoporphyrin O-methyltransferase [Tetrabaena socialis]
MQCLNQKPFTAARPVAARRAVRCSAHARPTDAALRAAAGAAVLSVASTSAAQAAEVFSAASGVDASLTFAVGGGVAIAGLGALLVATDPQKRRAEQMEKTGGDELEAVKTYFNTAGFERWRKIYGETDEVNKVQMDIRTGHAMTVEKVLAWVDAEGNVAGTTVCDAGCGTGSLAIPLALRGASVSASDISAAMVGEAERRYNEALAAGAGSAPKVAPKFEATDLESVKGKFNTVTCLDVMIHYPQDKVDGMITHLASLADNRLIISFAPKTIAYSILKRIGELFPGPSKATRAYLHAEDDVEAALKRAGFKVVKKEMTATNFYFSRLFEAVRV